MKPTIESKEGMFYINNNQGIMVAKIVYDWDDQKRIVVTSTFVDPSLRGQGIANRLMAQVIALAESKNSFIVPICSFAVKVLSQPQYLHLKDPQFKD